RFVWSDSSVSVWFFFVFFFSNNLSSSVIYTLSLHDALPILMIIWLFMMMQTSDLVGELKNYQIYLIPDKPYKKLIAVMIPTFMKDRKSTRLNSSHVSISYAVFCLKKKKHQHKIYKHRHI